MIQDEIQSIVLSLRPEDRDYIRDLPGEHLIRLQHTLGRTLRNAFRSNSYPYLFAYCYEQDAPDTRSFDSISQTALKLIWEHIRHATNVA
jgi:hypothetical protein